MDLSPGGVALVAMAAVAAGVVNAVAGGGTLLAFPALTLVGIPTVDAVVGTTIALVPGYVGGAFAQRTDLTGQRPRIIRLVPAGVLGGLAGAALLAVTDEGLFRNVVPWLIFAACAVLASQDQVRAAVDRRAAARRTDETVRAAPHTDVAPLAAGITFVAAIYGGYFGAGLGIILLAVLGVLLDDEPKRINALKQVLSFSTNAAAAGLLLFSGRVPWTAVGIMAVGSLAGGAIGGRLAGRLHPQWLRTIVIVLGLVVGVVYLVRR